MNEQRPTQSSPCPPRPDPCAGPAPASDGEPKCPEPKACPRTPEQPCPAREPDPCTETAAPPDPAGAPPSDKPPRPSDPAQTAAAGKPAGESASSLLQQLEELRKIADDDKSQLSKLESLKAKVADATARITALEKLVEEQPAAATAYADFYRTTEVFRSSLECSIPTLRCQLVINEKQKQCVQRAIATVDERVMRARSASDVQRKEVERLEKRQTKLDRDLVWAKTWNDFFKTTLQAQVTAQKEDLKTLQALADPSKDACEVWFYLNEMQSMLRSARADGEDEACYLDTLNVATFLDCWSPKCYTAASQYWVVHFNEAEIASKVGALELSEAQKRADELENAAKEAESKRREWVLKEINVQDCCGPLSRCP